MKAEDPVRLDPVRFLAETDDAILADEDATSDHPTLRVETVLPVSVANERINDRPPGSLAR
jgi:hypothetical protein